MISQEISFAPADNGRLAHFCGQFDAHFRQIESRLQVEIANRGNQFKVTGLDGSVKAACAVMQTLFASTEQEQLTAERVVLKDVDGISFTFFDVRDVVRHPLVQRIVSAYEKKTKAES